MVGTIIFELGKHVLNLTTFKNGDRDQVEVVDTNSVIPLREADAYWGS